MPDMYCEHCLNLQTYSLLKNGFVAVQYSWVRGATAAQGPFKPLVVGSNPTGLKKTQN